ncbi:MAG: response regulator [Candidatus Zixiibacteriota bacterium]|nr:MAG: response regulator [candidate division Zixibacteria bacterium]
MDKETRVLVVDDEPLARERICSLLSTFDRIKVVAQCNNGRDAISSIRKLSPDLVFLDIQMPEVSGIEVVKEIGVENMPVVVFVTAYDQYAVTAFEIQAFDYLLKPFDKTRFDEAVRRAVEEVSRRKHGAVATGLRELLDTFADSKKIRDRILIKSSGRIVIVKVDQIDWIESAGNYVKLHLGHTTHLLRETMKGMEARLKENHFARIHRETIVRVDRIKELITLEHGDYQVLLQDGTRLTMSRRYRDRLGDFDDLLR